MSQNINDLLVDDSKSEESTKLDEKLSEIKNSELEEEIKQRATSINLSYVNLKGFPISQDALSFIDEEKAKSLSVICFALLDKDAKIATTDPDNPQLKKFLKEIEESGKGVELFLSSQLSFNHALKLYDNLPKFIPMKSGVSITKEDLEKYKQDGITFDKLDSLIKKADTSELIAALISVAIQVDASDIHIEAQSDDIKVRLRIDGILHVVSSLKTDVWPKIISRIKLFSGLKINITTKPQDGRFTINLDKDSVDVRVSTIPTNFGESVVMRLLRSSSVGLDFDQLGVRGKSFVDIKKQIDRPNGMIITTGPTGSGKTTTLYAILTKLNSTKKKIITLEDPVEYKLPGINQSQIDKNADYSFAMGLKSILRQDPDIVMVGEIRDLETADISINAALTGHLVISTLHTNSASGAIPRFLAMGVKPFLLSPALNAIIGQRLVRKLCPDCKEEEKLDNDKLTTILNILNQIPVNSGSQLDKEELNNLKFYKSRGCEKCHGLGYKGRIGIYEILLMSKEIETAIFDNKVSEIIIQELAQKNGMVTMVQDGLLKAKDGITSIEEVFAVAD